MWNIKKFKFRLERMANTKEKLVKQKKSELANLFKKLELTKSELNCNPFSFEIGLGMIIALSSRFL